MIPVAGRGMIDGRVSIRATTGGLVIRVDDDGRPEFWLECSISVEKLREWVQRIERIRPGESGYFDLDELPELPELPTAEAADPFALPEIPDYPPGLDDGGKP